MSNNSFVCYDAADCNYHGNCIDGVCNCLDFYNGATINCSLSWAQIDLAWNLSMNIVSTIIATLHLFLVIWIFIEGYKQIKYCRKMGKKILDAPNLVYFFTFVGCFGLRTFSFGFF